MADAYESYDYFHIRPPVEPESDVAFTEDGLAFLQHNRDSYLNAMNQQALWNREDLLKRQGEQREDFEMDRLFKAAERNGVNPLFLLDALRGTTGQAASYSTSASKTSNIDTNARTDQANSAKIFGALIAAIGIVVAHMI